MAAILDPTELLATINGDLVRETDVTYGATLNPMRAGAAVPIKFGLGGNRRLDILAAGAPSSYAVACPGGTAPDDIEQTVAAGTVP